MLTAYDTHGKIVDSVGIDVILVGDSASCRVMAGYETTLLITSTKLI
jgi:ketopantoate hydroxymethyltransferase